MMTGCSDISRPIFDSDVSSSSNERLVEAVEEETVGGAGGGGRTVRSSVTASFEQSRKPRIVFIREKELEKERERESGSFVDVNAR